MNSFVAEFPVFSLLVAGQLGMIGHWMKRWAKDQTNLGLMAFFHRNRKATIGSMLVLVSLIVGMVATDLIVGNAKTLAAAFLAGFNLNSIFTPHEETPLEKN